MNETNQQLYNCLWCGHGKFTLPGLKAHQCVSGEGKRNRKDAKKAQLSEAQLVLNMKDGRA